MNNIKIVTDHIQKLSIPRDQYDRPTCLAFAASDINQFNNDLQDPLSVEFIIAALAYDYKIHIQSGIGTSAIKNVIAQPGQVQESICHYGLQITNYPAVSRNSKLYRSNLTINNKLSFDEAVELLIKRGPIVLGFVLNTLFFKPPANNVIDNTCPEKIANHAVTAVGVYEDSDNNQYIKIKNSWGVKWGVQGCALVTEAFYNERLLALLY
ncbi:C1 family peptidase [Pleionea mediterranea]|uniref:Papain like protease n=1 Tax=Pleionea mediterranea TaxID=523701 RepID=A0A316GDW1_9GAMM|nr:C1 family peptidase [Pleionea mediterranea]PWK52847.1 papain like protease [Pleionea mediterranea]